MCLWFPFSALTLLVGHSACEKLGVGLLVVTIWLALCTSYSSNCRHSPPPSSFDAIKFRMETVWCQLVSCCIVLCLCCTICAWRVQNLLHVYCIVLVIGVVDWCHSLYRDPVSVSCVQFTTDTKRIIAGMANGSISVCIIHRSWLGWNLWNFLFLSCSHCLIRTN